DENTFFFDDIKVEKDMLRWKNNTDEQTIESLKISQSVLASIDENEWTLANIEAKLLEAAGDKRGDLLWPLRVALTAAQKSPSPFEVSWVLGKKECLARIESALLLF
ncbi:MAG: Glutamate-tRNA ligase, partial [uncultured bacterium]